MKSSIGDEAVQRALQKRRELEQEIRQIDLFVSLYEQFAGHPVSHERVAAAEFSGGR